MTVRLPSPRALLLPLGLAGLIVALSLPPADGARGQGARAKAGKDDEAPKEGKDKAIADGLRWLALHQGPDGRWSLNGFNRLARTAPLPGGRALVCNCGGLAGQENDVAATAFGLLPFLGAGHTHMPGPKPPDYSKTVNTGLAYLLKKQSRDGNFSSEMYSNALATAAVCEAYGLTRDPKLKAPAQRAVNFIAMAQHPAGGWRYAPGQAGDLSVTGYDLTALQSAQLAGLNVPKKVLAQAEKFVGSCATPDKGFSYLPNGGAATPTMTAVGALCRQYLGAGPRDPGLRAAAGLVRKSPPGRTNNLYYEYYAGQVMRRLGGDDWKEWNEGAAGAGGMRDLLLKRQDAGAGPGHDHQKGSWSPAGEPHGNRGGRVMYTALALLALELEDARLPLFRQGRGPALREKD
jgi:hypothetical protein